MNRLESEGFSLTHRVCENDLLDILKPLGNVRVDPRSPEAVRVIRPQPFSSAKENTLSSRYGTAAFPFHTDTAHWAHPAQYLVLFCVNPGEGQRPTLIQDSRNWPLGPAEYELACKALWRTGHLQPKLCTLAEPTSSSTMAVRYDRDCMRPMTAEARRLEGLLDVWISCASTVEITWEPQSLLVLNNRRMVHARGISKRTDTNRLHKRILIGGD